MPTKDDKLTVISYHDPELNEKIFFFISGVIMSIPFAFFYENLVGSLSSLVNPSYIAIGITVIGAPFIEEFSKVYPLFYRHGEKKKNIFILGMLVGLGFGIAEFLIYVLLRGAPIFVRFYGIFFHAASASIAAYGIAVKKPGYFYLLAVTLHVLNNFFAITDLWLYAGLVVAVSTYITSWFLYNRLQK
jgi:RsiW-degrading membrane proteinase PrsW (M82 family)